MRILGGWIALTPELSAKLLWAATSGTMPSTPTRWGRRLPELRAHAQESEPANDAFVAFMDAIEAPEAPGQTVERLVGVYRVLKPHLLAVYEQHLAQRQPGVRAAHAPDPRALHRGRAAPHRGRRDASSAHLADDAGGARRAPRRGRRGSASLLGPPAA